MALTGIVKQMRNKCIVCEGAIEKSNMGTMCNACKDRLGGVQRAVDEKAPAKALKARAK